MPLAPVPTHNPGGKTRRDWRPDSVVTATFSPCQQYRYDLTEIWDASKPLVMWLLMNPSTADTDFSDPTLSKTGKYAATWGYGGQIIANVHAYRATDARRLLTISDPVGPDNDATILKLARAATKVVLAYGIPQSPMARPMVMPWIRRIIGLSRNRHTGSRATFILTIVFPFYSVLRSIHHASHP